MTEGEPERNLADEPREWASRYTKSKLRAPLHCTASDDGPCHVVEDLQAWNEFLCHAQLELRECRPGKLCLTPLDHGQYQCSSHRRRRKAFILVYWLLARHRCLVDAYLVALPGFHEHDAISSGLRSASELKALRIDSMSPESRLLPQGPAPVTPFLTGLEELHCDVRDPPLGLLESICSILESSQSLKTVALPNLRMNYLEARLLWDALSRGSTLRALFISSTALLPTNGYQREAISKFAETAATLNTLGISSSGCCTREELDAVVRYLRRPEISLSSISLRSFSVDDEGGKERRLLLTEKDALRIFKMEDYRWYGVRSGLAGFPRYDTDDYGSLTQRILPWLIILQRNCTLEELQLKLEGFCPAECAAFFQALSSNENLTKVSIEDIHAYLSARGRRMGTIDPPLDNYAMIFSECVRRCKFRLSLLHASDMDWFTATIQRLQSLDTITSLELID